MARRVLSSIRQWQRDMLPLGNDLRKLEGWVNEFDNRIGTIETATGIRTPTVSGSTLDCEFIAGTGMSGGGFLSYGSLTFNVGAGTGITVNADTIELDAAYRGANPTTPIGLATINGTATSYMRSDGAPALDVGIVPTWTGIHTFSAQDVHNAGIDLGTSGRFDSNVADAAAASSFLFQPTVDLTDGTDRYTLRLNNSSGTSQMTMFSNGLVEFNGLLGANTGFMQIGGTIPSGPHLGINFGPTAFTSSGTIGPFTTAVGGALFQTSVATTLTLSQCSGAFSATQSTTGTVSDMWAGLFQTTRSGNNTTTSVGCIYLRDNSSQAKGVVTTWYGIYGARGAGASGSSFPAAANRYWINLTELTNGSGERNSILLQAAGTSTYKALAFRDQNAWINSNDANHIDLHGTDSIDFNIGTTENVAITSGVMTFKDVFNVAVGTGTGTKYGTATGQKQGWWNATPIVQPTTAHAAATFVANTSGIVDDSATWDGYTLGQVVKALRDMGKLA